MMTVPPVNSPALHRLLDDAQRFPPEYGDQLSSHLPMALTALAGLAASAAQMRIAVDALNQKLALVRQGGDAASRARHTARGKLLVRDRIKRLRHNVKNGKL